MKKLGWLVGGWLLTSCQVVGGLGSQQAGYNRIELSTTVSEKLSNDTLSVVFSIQSERSDRQLAMNEVSSRLNQVLHAVGTNSAFKGKILNRSGSSFLRGAGLKNHEKPVWREIALVEVVSQDIAALDRLIAQLQNWASVQSLDFSVSRQKKLELESKLEQQGIKSFRGKAEQVTKAFGGKDYRIVSVTLDQITPSYHSTFSASSAAQLSSAPVVVDSQAGMGEQTLKLELKGVIEIVY
ncbi:MAG: SIMPL domain-containing protein [Neisseriaceae bacterium]